MLQNRFKVCQVFGFSIYIDWTWFFLLILIVWSLTNAFANFYSELSTTTHVVMGFVGAIGLFVSIILHEMAHAVAARNFGLPISDITLFIFGGVAEMRDEPPSPKAEFWTAIAGPIATIFIGLFSLICFSLSSTFGGPQWFTGIAGYITAINAILLLFNLIPAFPLDGGRVLRSAIWYATGQLRKATRISSILGSCFGFVLIFSGLFSLMFGNFIGGLWWILIGFFLHTAAQMSFKQLAIRNALKGDPVSKFMNTNVIRVPANTTLSDIVEEYVYRYHHKMFPVVDEPEMKLLGCITTKEIKEIDREKWSDYTAKDIAKACNDENTIAPNADAMEAFAKMNQTGQSRLLVKSDSDLEGIITLKDLMNHLSIKMELEDEQVPK